MRLVGAAHLQRGWNLERPTLVPPPSLAISSSALSGYRGMTAVETNPLGASSWCSETHALQVVAMGFALQLEQHSGCRTQNGATQLSRQLLKV